jgi:hypothetical protein
MRSAPKRAQRAPTWESCAQHQAQGTQVATIWACLSIPKGCSLGHPTFDSKRQAREPKWVPFVHFQIQSARERGGDFGIANPLQTSVGEGAIPNFVPRVSVDGGGDNSRIAPLSHCEIEGVVLESSPQPVSATGEK